MMMKQTLQFCLPRNRVSASESRSLKRCLSFAFTFTINLLRTKGPGKSIVRRLTSKKAPMISVLFGRSVTGKSDGLDERIRMSVETMISQWLRFVHRDHVLAYYLSPYIAQNGPRNPCLQPFLLSLTTKALFLPMESRQMCFKATMSYSC